MININVLIANNNLLEKRYCNTVGNTNPVANFKSLLTSVTVLITFVRTDCGTENPVSRTKNDSDD